MLPDVNSIKGAQDQIKQIVGETQNEKQTKE